MCSLKFLNVSLKFVVRMLNSSLVPYVFLTLDIMCCQCLNSFKLGILSCFHRSDVCSCLCIAVHPFLLQQVVAARNV